MEEKRDIFDRLMHLPVLNIFEPFYKKHKEVLMYLFFGGITFFLNIALYAWLDGMLGINAVFITWLGFNSMAVKLIAQVVVIVLNYIISKLIVFKK